MTDDLRTRIMAVLRDLGWTCEYHEPVSALGECKQCDKSHGSTADAVIRDLYDAGWQIVPPGDTEWTVNG